MLLITALNEKADISKGEANEVIHMFFDSLTNAMAQADRVETRGLCSFYVKNIKPTQGETRIQVK